MSENLAYIDRKFLTFTVRIRLKIPIFIILHQLAFVKIRWPSGKISLSLWATFNLQTACCEPTL